jgi:acetyl esterase
VFLLLIYPVVDNTEVAEETPSAVRYAQGYELSLEAFQWFQNQYFGDDNSVRHQLEASPALSSDFTGLPPTLIIVAELDPLADAAVSFGERLQRDGVEVQISIYPGVMHAFVTMGYFFGAAFQAMDESVSALRHSFGG